MLDTLPDLLRIFYSVVVPVFMIAGFGFVADRRFTIHTRSISQLLIYFVTPALVFTNMLKSSLNSAELGRLALFTFLMVIIMAVVSYLLAFVLRLKREQSSAFALSTTMINSGNMGLPLAAFAFGNEGLSLAVVIFTLLVIVGNVLGIFFASSGSASVKQSLLNIIKVPLAYAVILGLAANQGYFRLPQPIEQGLSLLGQATVPMMLLMLGIQLSRTKFNAQISLVALASGVRIIIAPILAFWLAGLLTMTGLTAQVAIVQVSMPTAVTAIILAEEFGSDTRFVSSVVLVSTLCSLISLSILLDLLL